MFDTKNEAAALGNYVTQYQSTKINALHVHAERMEASAAEARAGYTVGQASPHELARQNASMVTNNGYKHMAQMFTHEASQARTVAAELTRLIEGDDKDEPQTPSTGSTQPGTSGSISRWRY